MLLEIICQIKKNIIWYHLFVQPTMKKKISQKQNKVVASGARAWGKCRDTGQRVQIFSLFIN